VNEEINKLAETIQRIKKMNQNPKPIARDLEMFAREILYNKYQLLLQDCRR